MERNHQITDEFKHCLTSNFQAYCQKFQLEVSSSYLINYLLDQKLINNSLLRRYLILDELRNTDYQSTSKTKTVKHLAQKYQVSDRSIWNIIKEIKTAP